ncbi:MAG: hemerythrin domain-containing protein [Lautropia sp.]
MSDLLVRWHAEHAKFGRLLALFERQLDAFHDGGDPDYGLMTDIVEYLQGYGDAFHHPREDVGFRHLLEKEPGARLVVERLLQEHRVIAQAGTALLERLHRIDADAMVARADLEQAAATYLVYYRHHLMKEESEVLPQIGRVFSEADWQQVGRDLEAAADPLFGDQVEARFARLRKQITRSTAGS